MKYYGYRTKDVTLLRDLQECGAFQSYTPWVDHLLGCFNGGDHLGSCTCGLSVLINHGNNHGYPLRLIPWMGHREGCLVEEAFCNCGLHNAHPGLWRL